MKNTNLDNLKALKRCRKLETLLFLLIMLPTAVLLVYMLIAIFSPIYNDLVIILSIVFRILYVVPAFVGLYCKKNYWVIAAPISSAINWVMTVNEMDGILCLIALAVAGGTVINNRVYAYLEQQEGFPYFNERFEMQKTDYDKFCEKDPFEAAAKERRKTATDKMEDLF